MDALRYPAQVRQEIVGKRDRPQFTQRGSLGADVGAGVGYGDHTLDRETAMAQIVEACCLKLRLDRAHANQRVTGRRQHAASVKCTRNHRNRGPIMTVEAMLSSATVN